jgi:hypothetical protein
MSDAYCSSSTSLDQYQSSQVYHNKLLVVSFIMLSIKTLITTLLLTGTALAIPEPINANAVENLIRDTPANPEAIAEAAILEDRKACKCAKVKNAGEFSVQEIQHNTQHEAGLYCGYCWLSNIDSYAVVSGRDNDNVYWCNKEGGCDNIGYRKSCGNRKGPCDGRDSG